MQQTIYEGGWKEISRHAEELEDKKLRLVVFTVDEAEEVMLNYFHASPEERARALDAIAEMNRNLPVLPPEAFERESLYE